MTSVLLLISGIGNTTPFRIRWGRETMKIPSIPSVLISAALIGTFSFLAFDGRLHWDEPYYLFAGGYLDLDDILKGDFQPSGIEGHYLSRIFHVLWIHLVVSVIGLGIPALAVVIGGYLALLFGFLYLAGRIVEELIPDAPAKGLSMTFLAFSPVCIYMAFKTQPEIPALFLSTLAVFALLCAMKGRPALWLSVVAAALCATVFLKNAMVLMFASFVLSSLLCKVPDSPRRKLFLYAAVSGSGSVALFFLLLGWMGLDLSAYLAVGAAVQSMSLPRPLWLLNILTEGGLLFLCVPLAFLARQRWKTRFFFLWFLFSTLPFLLLRYVEPRFLIVNLPALAGLVALSWKGFEERAFARNPPRPSFQKAAAVVVILSLAVTGGLAQRVMPHEVRWDQQFQILDKLDRRYGKGAYALLIPWSYTDFHFLRFAFPERSVYNVHTPDLAEAKKPFWSGDLAKTQGYYGARLLRSREEVSAVELPAVYLGFGVNHTAANLLAIADWLHWEKVAARIRGAGLLDHLDTSWMWRSLSYSFEPVARAGHYEAFRVR